MDLTVCHKQIEEKWRQQIIVVAEHEFSNIEDIDFLDLMRFDMTFDVTLRDESSFGKLTNSCN